MRRPELDLLASEEVVMLLLDAEARVVPAARLAVPAIAEGAQLLSECLGHGGRLIFVGAGTSGRIAAAEAAELPGTFGLSRKQILCRVAGGLNGTDDDEDDVDGARRDVAELALTPRDAVIAVAASGSTPYTLAVAEAAVAFGCALIAVVTRAGSPLVARAQVGIEVLVGAEVLQGSTRLTAGTSQKVALNALTTAAMARSGRVHGDLMIDVVAANAKLEQRAAAIVADIAGCAPERAERALRDCGGNARAAVLVIVSGLDPAAARAKAAAAPSLRAALNR
ncbi:N-acetylmuramic acid 6-phosphate etherase [Jatrophihabitans telluris]|uniref:N-acetylmuramic acid 6-phosphate etherase n=1 Tax=Jatrophihabitans telluris TaxID=2038343 RepID=A0ABY4R0W2_9ACTN|nr:N-acetylmuramic acid 6-phosphate etherase [Jatrophihabitans telluris]UQX89420.1 N-acetylmuramic acid 6-phosphate etherase [Jatrophihabitans telluris]